MGSSLKWEVFSDKNSNCTFEKCNNKKKRNFGFHRCRRTFAFLLSVLVCSSWRFEVCVGMRCYWNMTATKEELLPLQCGYSCVDPWIKPDPYYCGPASVCCCVPTCVDYEEKNRQPFIGLNWSDRYSRAPLKRTKAFEIMKSVGVVHIKTFSPDGLSDIYKVYGDKAKVYVGIPNRDLTALSIDLDYAKHIVNTQIKPFEKIVQGVIVGNEPFLCIRTVNWYANGECGELNAPLKLFPSMKNIHKALLEANMNVIVSSPFNGGLVQAIDNPYTVCMAIVKVQFRDVLLPILQFLLENDYPFIVNLYSWFASMHGGLTPKQAVGATLQNPLIDGQFKYYSVYDQQYEAQRIALCKIGYGSLDIWIGETGWPTGGHIRATLPNAKVSNDNVLKRAMGLRIFDSPLDHIRYESLPYTVFLFEAFDEEKKFEIEHGNAFENSFGIFYEDGTPKWADEHGKLDLHLPGILRQKNETVRLSKQEEL